MCHSISLHWRLSVLSPVDTAQSNARPVMGPPDSELIRCTIDSDTCAVSVSCGRCAPFNGMDCEGGSE
jgi:hypothetical protein